MARRPRLSGLVLALSLAAAAPAAFAGPVEDDRARNALRVLREIREIPESAIPDKLLDEARAIVVVPDTLKIGLVVGGRRGHGLMAVKNADGTWSQPAFVKLTGGSIGFQAGLQSSDIVLVFRGDRGVDSIVNGKVTLGADASVAAGPVGRSAATATDGQLKAEIWSWSRARGLFAGIALDGAALQVDDEADQLAYGAGTTPRMIFEGRATGKPSNALVDFRDALEEASAAARAERNGTSSSVAASAAQPVTPVNAPTTAPASTSTPVPASAPAAADPKPQPFQNAEPAVKTEPLP
ncbi:lipid-binding SYLF domain-containing protein [Cognatilysobacter terrigena]|uniref:lipid-binding SYLF domain-containing protein n=1 Tax=Cognatilysobacter terrigena TaxID=2488749 RepID=UPI00105C6625|nr:lipid-binding SYLF domain-containing protein [Lysobacter terrigena]